MGYFGKIKGARNLKNKTELDIILDDDILKTLNRYHKGGNIITEVNINDGRRITVEQRKKAYATMGDIADYLGYAPEQLKELMKYRFCGETGEKYFSLSNCNLTTARNFINFLIKFVIEWDIPLTDLAVNRTEDIDKYLYYCLKYRRCAISGKPHADIHHCSGSQVGMGGNRRKIDNTGRKLIALSREWHTKVHAEGEDKIFKAYKVYGIEIDRQTLKDLGLHVKDIS